LQQTAAVAAVSEHYSQCAAWQAAAAFNTALRECCALLGHHAQVSTLQRVKLPFCMACCTPQWIKDSHPVCQM